MTVRASASVLVGRLIGIDSPILLSRFGAMVDLVAVHPQSPGLTSLRVSLRYDHTRGPVTRPTGRRTESSTDSVFLHPVGEGLVVGQTDQRGGLRLAACFFESALKVVPRYGGDELPNVQTVSQRATDNVLVGLRDGHRHSRPDVIRRDCSTRTPDRCLKQYVLELPHVAWPGVTSEKRPCRS